MSASDLSPPAVNVVAPGHAPDFADDGDASARDASASSWRAAPPTRARFSHRIEE